MRKTAPTTDANRLSAYVPEETKSKLEQAAKKQHRSLSNMLALILENHVDDYISDSKKAA